MRPSGCETNPVSQTRPEGGGPTWFDRVIVAIDLEGQRVFLEGTRFLTYRRQFDLKQRELGKQQYPMVQALFARAEKNDAETLVLLRK
ncbi:MAG TPA: hypothetical protein VNW71_17320 [Thermoanaerobaculia bacterium]|nr:hypothetical protein [Thermoanaerobaculia bacterium]